MKILKDGKIPEPPKPWWVGKQHKCSFCQAEIEFEQGDNITEQATRTLRGRRWFVFKCPFCYSSQEHQEVIYR
jgi:hypothetical protein